MLRPNETRHEDVKVLTFDHRHFLDSDALDDQAERMRKHQDKGISDDMGMTRALGILQRACHKACLITVMVGATMLNVARDPMLPINSDLPSECTLTIRRANQTFEIYADSVSVPELRMLQRILKRLRSCLEGYCTCPDYGLYEHFQRREPNRGGGSKGGKRAITGMMHAKKARIDDAAPARPPSEDMESEAASTDVVREEPAIPPPDRDRDAAPSLEEPPQAATPRGEIAPEIAFLRQQRELGLKS